MAKTLSFKTRLTMRADGRNDPHHGFGKGIEMLLLGVDKYGSLNRAAKEMGMAYSKAWNVLRLNESEFGIKFINRNGAHGFSGALSGNGVSSRARRPGSFR